MNVLFNSINKIPYADLSGGSSSSVKDIHGGGFVDAMNKALELTSKLQGESGRLSREVSLGNPTVSLEDAMVASVKSNVAFQATLQSRNRIIQAYTDVMNMQV